MSWSDVKRRTIQRTRNAASRGAEDDDELTDKRDRLYKMATDMNDLGAGIYECLKDTKKSYETSWELSLTVDKFYNGPFADEWPEARNSMKLHGPVTRYKEAWNQAHSKLRPAAASAAVERALAQVRYFLNESMPQIKVKVEERNAAKLDFESYKRRHEKLGGKGDQAKNQQARQKLETSEARFNALSAKLKDDLIKEKIARDGIVEEAAVTFIVCQHAMYKELAANLGDLVEALPQDKVLSIQKRITDTVLTGGPSSKVAEDSAIGKVAKVAVGMKTVGDYTKSEEQQAQEAREEAEATERAVALAQREQGMLQAQGGGGGAVAGSDIKARSESDFGTVNPVSRLLAKPLEQPPPPPPVSTIGGEGGEQYRALYDCDAEGDGDLAFKAGDLVQVTHKDDSGWWQGSLLGAERSGVFPANYVEVAA